MRGEDQAPVAVGPSDREFRVAVERGEDVEDVDEGAEGEAETSGGAAARGWLLGAGGGARVDAVVAERLGAEVGLRLERFPDRPARRK